MRCLGPFSSLLSHACKSAYTSVVFCIRVGPIPLVDALAHAFWKIRSTVRLLLKPSSFKYFYGRRLHAC
jgi:hypothetical protein